MTTIETKNFRARSRSGGNLDVAFAPNLRGGEKDMKIAWETLAATVLIAASILFIGRYQISAAGSGAQYGGTFVVYQLDRWTGKVDRCEENQTKEGTIIECPANDPTVQKTN
jgi:hypothetical protein